MTLSARRAVGAVAAVGLAAALVLGSALSASAHDSLVSSDPAADSTVAAAVDTVTLTFNDDVLNLGESGSASIVEVTSGAKHYESACAVADGKIVTVPVALGAPGDYTVAYSIVSADGHRVAAEFGFTYAPPAGTDEASGAATSPCKAVADGGDSGDSGASSTTIILIIAAGVVVLAIVGVLLALMLTRRKGEPDA